MRVTPLVLLLVPACLSAQDSRLPVTALRRHVESLAHDSMSGRPTPSIGLEKSADYVTHEFGTMGLKRWGNDSSYLMRYPVPGHPGDSTENVVALIEGTDPALQREFIVITAHLDGLGTVPNAPAGSDSVLNGADDNASGVAALLEIARALATSGTRPRRSILFAAVSGEETGLWGSEYLLSLSEVQGGRVVANLNMDMVGRAVGDSVFLVTTEDLRTTQIVAKASDAHRSWGLHLLDRAELDRRYPGQELEDRSDHATFVRRGIPAVVIFTGLHEDYHRPGDTADKISYGALALIVRMAADITGALANLPE